VSLLASATAISHSSFLLILLDFVGASSGALKARQIIARGFARFARFTPGYCLARFQRFRTARNIRKGRPFESQHRYNSHQLLLSDFMEIYFVKNSAASLSAIEWNNFCLQSKWI
jgi:hypothetical protein